MARYIPRADDVLDQYGADDWERLGFKLSAQGLEDAVRSIAAAGGLEDLNQLRDAVAQLVLRLRHTYALNVAKQILEVTFSGCARCGETHKDLWMEPLSRPLEIRLQNQRPGGVLRLTHWAPCPNTGQPILMHQVDEAEVEFVGAAELGDDSEPVVGSWQPWAR